MAASKLKKGRKKSRAPDKKARAAADGTTNANGTTAPRGVQRTDPGTAEELAAIDAIEVDLTSFDDAAEDALPDVEVDVDLTAQRRAVRVRVDEKVEISGMFGVGAGGVRDASLHGVFVETAFLLEVGDPVSLTFPLEGGGRLKVSGRVRWVTPFGGLRDARPGMGIELVSPGDAARSQLDALLSRRAAPGGG